VLLLLKAAAAATLNEPAINRSASNMSTMKYGIACVLVSMCAFYMHQHGEFHFAAATMTLGGGHHSPPLSCIDAADIGPVTDLVLLPAGGVLVASMSANASQPGRISLLSSTAFPPTAPSRAPELLPVSVSGFSAHTLRPQALHLLSHSDGILLFVVQQWPASDRAFERYMQHRGAKRDEGPPQPLATIEVFLVVQDQATEVQLIHQRSLHHGHSDTITSVVAASPKQLYISTSCHSHSAPLWKRTLEALSPLACCSSIWLLNIDCGSEENCFDTHLGGDISGLGLWMRARVWGFCVKVMPAAAAAVATGMRNVRGMSFTPDKKHLLAAEATARSIAVFQAEPVDGKLVRVAAVPVAFAVGKLSLSHSRLLAAGHVQALRTALFAQGKVPVDSMVAVVSNLNAEQCSQNAQQSSAPAAQALLDVKRVTVSACVYATESALVLATEAHGARVCSF
jgi:hypothetical protein